MADQPIPAKTVETFKSEVPPIWCPGCGDFGVLSALYKTLLQLDLNPKDVCVASGIGCSGRLPIFTTCYGFHGVHGRVLPTAMGIKLANPKLTVISVGGDGDGLAIGGGHFPHAARRNVDITYIMMDNSVYGLTKGQASPTTPSDNQKVRSGPYGRPETSLNPIGLALAYNASFVARAYSGKLQQMVDIFSKAIQHKGFSFVHVLSPCVVFNDTYPYYKANVVEIPQDHDPSNKSNALELWQTPEKVFSGIFYLESRPDYGSYWEKVRKDLQGKQPITVEQVFDQYV